MSITLKTSVKQLDWITATVGQATGGAVTIDRRILQEVLASAMAAHQLHALINNPHTDEFLQATRLEAAHQRDRWGEAHDRGKSAENWFWLVGYLAGKCLRAVITGDKPKALHHTISSAAALANWYEAIKKDETGCGHGADADIKPVEIARFETRALPVVGLAEDVYSGR
ncbi:MAG: hypothetical protein KF740_19885 [Ramlibacter sp.]|nr:hypothetical protein [Ramlibacter sp.]